MFSNKKFQVSWEMLKRDSILADDLSADTLEGECYTNNPGNGLEQHFLGRVSIEGVSSCPKVSPHKRWFDRDGRQHSTEIGQQFHRNIFLE